jgi:hypothetical protein
VRIARWFPARHNDNDVLEQTRDADRQSPTAPPRLA